MKITRSSLSDQVADYLREQIYVRRRYRPGDFIREQDISSEFGVSRGPVRDAIKLLVSEGLLESSPWRSTRVISFAGEEVQDIAELRQILEKRALQGLMARGPEKGSLKELEETLKAMEDLTACEEPTPQARDSWVELDQRFRAVLAAKSGLKWTERMLSLLSGQMRFLELTRDLSLELMAATTARHRSVLEALKKDDPSKLPDGSLPERELWEQRNWAE